MNLNEDFKNHYLLKILDFIVSLIFENDYNL